MTPKDSVKILVLAAAASLGLVTFASAQAANVAVRNPATPSAQGLLGQTLTGVTYDYLQLKNGPPSAGRGFTFSYNQSLNSGFDGAINYQLVRSQFSGTHAVRQRVDADLIAFSTSSSFGKPFIQTGIGYEWDRVAGAGDDSFTYQVGAGIEFQATPAFAVTPYVNFLRATAFNENEYGYGVKASYRIGKQWSAIAKIQYNDITNTPNNTQYSLGVNLHF